MPQKKHKTARDLVSNNASIHLKNSVWNLFLILYVEQIIISMTISSVLLLGLRDSSFILRGSKILPASKADILCFFSGKSLL